MGSPPVRILICDDHDLIRDGLIRILLESGVAKDVGAAAGAPDAIAMVRRENWDVVILDINLGSHNGLDLLKEIRAEFPRLPVLVLSIYPEEQYAVRVMRSGASGYLNKNLARKTLVEAVRQVLAGQPYISAKVALQLVAAVSQPGAGAPHTLLSSREDQVMRRIAAGQTVGEIAVQLHLSVRTVSTYRTKILEKLGLENNAQIMRYAHDHHLVGEG